MKGIAKVIESLAERNDDFRLLLYPARNHPLVFMVLKPINTGSTPLKLQALYSPPNHGDGVVHLTRADAEADTEQLDGRTSE